MNIADAILWKYPNASPVDDFNVVDHNDGEGQQIAYWAIKDSTGADVPSPTDSDLNDWYFSFLKEQKTKQLDGEFDVTLMSGFKSSALGVEHTYPSDFQAMIFFNATMNRIANDATFTTTNQKTLDAGYLPHTREQFIQVFNDGHQNGEDLISRLNAAKAKVDQAQKPEDLDAIDL